MPSSSSHACFVDDAGLLSADGRLRNFSIGFLWRNELTLWPSRASGENSVPKLVPPWARKTISRVLKKCIRCFRTKPRLLENVMADLPPERVKGFQWFDFIGVDFCGLFLYKAEVRNKASIIRYEGDPFGIRQGPFHSFAFFFLRSNGLLVRDPWSDKATHFVGAKNDLIELKRRFLSFACF